VRVRRREGEAGREGCSLAEPHCVAGDKFVDVSPLLGEKVFHPPLRYRRGEGNFFDERALASATADDDWTGAGLPAATPARAGGGRARR